MTKEINNANDLMNVLKECNELLLLHHIDEDLKYICVALDDETHQHRIILQPKEDGCLPLEFVDYLGNFLTKITHHDWSISMVFPKIESDFHHLFDEDATIDNGGRIQVLKPGGRNDKLLLDFNLDNLGDSIDCFYDAIPDAIYYYDKCDKEESEYIRQFAKKMLKSNRQVAKLLDVFDVPYSVY